MNNKTRIAVVATLAVTAVGLLGWQSWNTHKLQQQVVSLQQLVAGQHQQSASLASTTSPPAANALAPRNSPGAPSQSVAPLISPKGSDPFWGGQDPFADMQQMQQQMHQHMQDLLSGLGMDQGSSLFDMDPFQGGGGFGSSMGFGAEPQFDFKENPANYQVTVSIPGGSNVEINTSVHGQDLTIEGKVSQDQQGQQKGGAFRSMQTREFARTLHLPADVDILGITNQNQKDKVVITLPKLRHGQLSSNTPKAAKPQL